MGGLLYKDFVAVKGKLMVLVWTGVIIAFTVLRMMFTGYGAGSAWRMEDVTGQMTNLVDEFFLTFYCLCLFIMLFQVNQYEGSMVEGDRKNKLMNYFNSMPIGKNPVEKKKKISKVFPARHPFWNSIYDTKKPLARAVFCFFTA